ncbi:hypothetical protein CAOG_04322 [Capsaspora owczarzaki ATCC 30864]|uniref:3'-5' exonuclease domain-containing protein n=1 Tax=Capsaspora owczarzaki (strain ATCC 30864) TaxID=595528 RepID=A0A0D2VRN6_CAPO3|nr:hypothetical protein CAOG_04322 [Capsaspora owczarzaki ATCC 30864]KJE93552.1 hypothetical protein CAOG_004322 [Capsaspora owczarzaki ATCC 30864]|eukprot:XP_004348150.2 hypothetical protein CAOG_04322 [Capsaspora owczarzaki ATCC 30864]
MDDEHLLLGDDGAEGWTKAGDRLTADDLSIFESLNDDWLGSPAATERLKGLPFAAASAAAHNNNNSSNSNSSNDITRQSHLHHQSQSQSQSHSQSQSQSDGELIALPSIDDDGDLASPELLLTSPTANASADADADADTVTMGAVDALGLDYSEPVVFAAASQPPSQTITSSSPVVLPAAQRQVSEAQRLQLDHAAQVLKTWLERRPHRIHGRAEAGGAFAPHRELAKLVKDSCASFRDFVLAYPALFILFPNRGGKEMIGIASDGVPSMKIVDETSAANKFVSKKPLQGGEAPLGAPGTPSPLKAAARTMQQAQQQQQQPVPDLFSPTQFRASSSSSTSSRATSPTPDAAGQPVTPPQLVGSIENQARTLLAFAVDSLPGDVPGESSLRLLRPYLTSALHRGIESTYHSLAKFIMHKSSGFEFVENRPGVFRRAAPRASRAAVVQSATLAKSSAAAGGVAAGGAASPRLQPERLPEDATVLSDTPVPASAATARNPDTELDKHVRMHLFLGLSLQHRPGAAFEAHTNVVYGAMPADLKHYIARVYRSLGQFVNAKGSSFAFTERPGIYYRHPANDPPPLPQQPPQQPIASVVHPAPGSQALAQPLASTSPSPAAGAAGAGAGAAAGAAGSSPVSASKVIDDSASRVPISTTVKGAAAAAAPPAPKGSRAASHEFHPALPLNSAPQAAAVPQPHAASASASRTTAEPQQDAAHSRQLGFFEFLDGIPVFVVSTVASAAAAFQVLHSVDRVAVDCEWIGDGQPGQEEERLSLVQIAAPATPTHVNGVVYLLDLLSDCAPASIIAPLGVLLARQTIVKVFHDARKDVALLTRSTGIAAVHNYADTQAEYAILQSLRQLVHNEAGVALVPSGTGANVPARVGLNALFEQLALPTNPLKATFAARFRTEKHLWQRRPLDRDSIVYAAYDTLHLLRARDMIRQGILACTDDATSQLWVNAPNHLGGPIASKLNGASPAAARASSSSSSSSSAASISAVGGAASSLANGGHSSNDFEHPAAPSTSAKSVIVQVPGGRALNTTFALSMSASGNLEYTAQANAAADELPPPPRRRLAYLGLAANLMPASIRQFLLQTFPPSAYSGDGLTLPLRMTLVVGHPLVVEDKSHRSQTGPVISAANLQEIQRMVDHHTQEMASRRQNTAAVSQPGYLYRHGHAANNPGDEQWHDEPHLRLVHHTSSSMSLIACYDDYPALSGLIADLLVPAPQLSASQPSSVAFSRGNRAVGVLVVGGRRAGKSALLRSIRDFWSKSPDAPTVFVDVDACPTHSKSAAKAHTTVYVDEYTGQPTSSVVVSESARNCIHLDGSNLKHRSRDQAVEASVRESGSQHVVLDSISTAEDVELVLSLLRSGVSVAAGVCATSLAHMLLDSKMHKLVGYLNNDNGQVQRTTTAAVSTVIELLSFNKYRIFSPVETTLDALVGNAAHVVQSLRWRQRIGLEQPDVPPPEKQPSAQAGAALGYNAYDPRTGAPSSPSPRSVRSVDPETGTATARVLPPNAPYTPPVPKYAHFARFELMRCQEDYLGSSQRDWLAHVRVALR